MKDNSKHKYSRLCIFASVWLISQETLILHKNVSIVYSSPSTSSPPKMDNASQFNRNEEILSYLKTNGIDHKMCLPVWFQANGEVEKRQIKSQIKVLRIPQEEKKSSEAAVILAVLGNSSNYVEMLYLHDHSVEKLFKITQRSVKTNE